MGEWFSLSVDPLSILACVVKDRYFQVMVLQQENISKYSYRGLELSLSIVLMPGLMIESIAGCQFGVGHVCFVMKICSTLQRWRAAMQIRTALLGCLSKQSQIHRGLQCKLLTRSLRRWEIPGLMRFLPALLRWAVWDVKVPFKSKRIMGLESLSFRS